MRQTFRLRRKSAIRPPASGLRWFLFVSLTLLGLTPCGLSGCSGCLAPQPNSPATPEPTAKAQVPPADPPLSPQSNEQSSSRESPAGSSHASAVSSNTTQETAPSADTPTDSQPTDSQPTDDQDSGSKTASANQDAANPASNPPRTTNPPPASKQKTPAADAETTLKTVSTLREKAKKATDQKDLGTAFRNATQAWEAARAHPKDARLRKIADELATELDALGHQLNAKFQKEAESTSTPLIEK